MMTTINLLMGTLFLSFLCTGLAIANETDANDSVVMSAQDIQSRIQLLKKKLDEKKRSSNRKNAEALERPQNKVTKHLSLTRNIKSLVAKNNADQKEIDLGTEGMKLRSSLLKQFPYLSQREVDDLVAKFEDNRLEGVTGAATADVASVKKVTYNPIEGQGYKTTTSTQVNKITMFLKKNKQQSQKIETKKIQVDPRLVEEGNATITELVTKKGDTLSDIARRNYGNASMYMPIFMANQDKLETPHFIPEGVKLKIPTIKNIKDWKDHPDTFKKKNRKKRKIIYKKKVVKRKVKKPRKNKIKPLSNRRVEEIARQILEGKL
jgi:nucleoid-associated protein YgaU